jgi:hypothetical protein
MRGEGEAPNISDAAWETRGRYGGKTDYFAVIGKDEGATQALHPPPPMLTLTSHTHTCAQQVTLYTNIP